MCAPSPPKPPDPASLAAAQGAANKETAVAQALLNMVNQQTPWGSLSYDQRGTVDGVPQFSATTELSPTQQQLFDQSQGNALGHQQLAGDLLGGVGDVLGQPFDVSDVGPKARLPDRSQLPGAPNAQGVPGFDGLAQAAGVPGGLDIGALPGGGQIPEASDAVRQRTEDAMFQRAKAQLDPVFEDRARRLETQLVNQGFARGSEGYNRALERFRQSENDAYQAALQDAIMAGGEEQSRLFGMGAQQFGMGEQQRTRALNEQLANFEAEANRFGMSHAERQQGVNEIMQQFGMGQQVFDQGMRLRQLGLGEQDTRFNQELERRRQAISEYAMERGQPLNELLGLMGRSGQVGMPQWAPTPQTGIGQTDVLGANALSQQAQWNAFNSQNQTQQGLMGALGNIGGAALGGWMMSDPDMKEGRQPFEPEQALEGMRDIPVESWRYKGDSQRRVGPMATDWAKQFGGDGKTIDTVSAFGLSMSAIQALADKVDKLEHQRG